MFLFPFQGRNPKICFYGTAAGHTVRTMSRYFLHVLRADGGIIPDVEGKEHENLEAAKHEAVLGLCALINDALLGGSKANGLRIRIADKSGQIVETVTAKQLFG